VSHVERHVPQSAKQAVKLASAAGFLEYLRRPVIEIREVGADMKSPLPWKAEYGR